MPVLVVDKSPPVLNLQEERYLRAKRPSVTCVSCSVAMRLLAEMMIRYRNEALDNLDALQAELKFILKQVTG